MLYFCFCSRNDPVAVQFSVLTVILLCVYKEGQREREKEREKVKKKDREKEAVISTLSTLSFTALSKVWFHAVVRVNCY